MKKNYINTQVISCYGEDVLKSREYSCNKGIEMKDKTYCSQKPVFHSIYVILYPY